MFRGARVFWFAIWRKLGYIVAGAGVAFLASQCKAASCVIESGGALVLTADPIESCTGFVLMTAAEFTDVQGFWTPLTVEQGGAIGFAIFGAWAVAFGLRMLSKQLLDA